MTLSPSQAALLLDVDRLTVYSWADKGILAGVTRDEEGHRRIPVESILEAKRSHAKFARSKKRVA
jgi:predicted site-specific integrase-resolvase